MTHRYTPQEIVDNLQMIVDISREPIDIDNPHSIVEKLNKLSCVIAIGSKCCGNAEYYYQTDKKKAEYQELRTLADAINKDIHYVITSIQSILKVSTIDYINAKNQV